MRLLFLSALFVLSVSIAAQVDIPEIVGRGHWGPETLGLVCRITTDRTEYTIGDKVYILIEVKNNTDKPVALGMEPLIEVRGGNLTRQPASINIGFSQNSQGQLGFDCGYTLPFPRGTKSEAKAVSLAPGKTYSEIFAREPWGPCFGCSPSTAQPGEMRISAALSQFLTPDLKRTIISANPITIKVAAKASTS